MVDEMARNGSMKSMDAGDDGKVTDQPEVTVDTAHQISTDSWYQVAFVLTTGVLSAYVLGYPGAVMVPLGWIPGVIGLILATLVSLYANILVARLHEFGGQRHIRYRDLAGFIYGEKAYYITWAMQYVNLYLINVGFIILAGHSLKAIYVLFRSDDVLRLPHFIAIAGFACAVFAISVPHLSAMRVWLGFSALFSLIYIFVGVWLSIRDGKRTPARDYSIHLHGSDRVYITIGSCANLVFSFNTGMLPEIQATVRQPVVSNTMKALFFQFTIGVGPMYLLIFAAYWAYGSGTSDYLLANVHGPATVKALASLAAFLQSVISLHIFASPMYEYLDTAFNISGEVMNPRNLTFRIVVRGGYVAVTAFVSAMLPFLGAFMSLTGAVSTFPLTFILAHHMYLKAKGDKLSRQQKQWHWANVAFFCALAVASFVAAIKEIERASKHFNLFANL